MPVTTNERQIIITQQYDAAYNCSSDLTIVKDAGLILCSDCFVFSLVDQSIASLSEEQMDLHNSHDSVVISIRPNNILEWLASQEEGQH
jgi:hypothetical protein